MRIFINKYVYGITVLVLFTFISLAITLYLSDRAGMGKPPKYLEEIKQLTNLNFPPTVQWIGHNLDRGMDYSWEAKFLIPKREIDKLFGDIKGEWKSDVRYLNNSPYSGKWFDPDSVQIYKSIDTYYPKEWTILRVLYDNSKTNDDDLIVCYIHWFELS